ncbi:septum site-determining protein MinC [Fusibacter ferrireducens]|uniref:Probable septum site-determining protein MinC n=1 Tax=Fusibacter ferrireducens TaxID=2785058 RepID=A0ABR9ZWN0_9FIRM|nr:septum site-determining protein MinC [Fusibacter ferrireducens]MBF4694869.1 septum site-determining protein MinC [Fusibacter ferrireducens]
MKGPVEFKGKLNGLFMVVDENVEFDKVLIYLKQLLVKKGDFYKGTRIIGLNGVKYSYKQKSAVEDVIVEAGLYVESLEPYDDQKKRQKPSIVVNEIAAEKEDTPKVEMPEAEEKDPDIQVESSDQNQNASDVNTHVHSMRCDTKFVYGTLRSGSSVEFPGNVIVIGDVNPGAEIIAEGNIVVMGKLLGFVHAGSAGNDEAVVIANILKPTQIRISKFISVPPNDDEATYNMIPEKAYVSDGLIKIEKCH